MDTTVPRLGELVAPLAWRTVDFISDLHLEAANPQTVDVFKHYLRQTPADAIIILGDLFEVWVGDDCLNDVNSFESQCAAALNRAAQQHAVYFMHGNRDFLIGQHFSKSTCMGLLNDPCVLKFADQNWLLSHGDAMCLADTDYMAFRNIIRTPQWRDDFLAKPLDVRREVARSIRTQSETRKQSASNFADVDNAMACAWLHAAQADTLIHGHTHKPAVHALRGLGCSHHRVVLSDWDASANPARAQVLRLTADGLTRINL